MAAAFDYDQQTLNTMANDAVKNLGTLTGWAVRVHNGGATLVVNYDANGTSEKSDFTVAL
jgi:hypothetical protein